MNPILATMAGLFALGVGVLAARAGSSAARGSTSTDPGANRQRFIDAARGLVGTLYQWGGGHAGQWWGLDCSGLVLESLKRAALPPLRPIWTAQSMWDGLPVAMNPEPGDLALYGVPGRVHHVTILDRPNSDGTWTVISANGDQNDTSPDQARARGHKVTIEPSHKFMSDFLGFRRVLP